MLGAGCQMLQCPWMLLTLSDMSVSSPAISAPGRGDTA